MNGKVLVFELGRVVGCVAAQLDAYTLVWSSSFEGLYFAVRKLSLVGCGGVELCVLIGPCATLVNRNFEGQLCLILLGSMHFLVMIIFCLVLLRHESEIEVRASQLLHSALGQ